MRSLRKPPARAACQSCHDAKIRCDGTQPCGRCSARNLTCSYRPSRRGGVRRRPIHKSRIVLDKTEPLFSAGSYFNQESPGILEQDNLQTSHSPGPYDLNSVINLLAPFPGIQNFNASLGGTRNVDDETNININTNRVGQPSIRSYASDEDILEAYYVYIHPFLPILPPPLSAKCHDRPIPINPERLAHEPLSQDYLPHWPTTSLTLVISAILALIPIEQSSEPLSDSSVSASHSQAQKFADAAFDEIHNEIEKATRTKSQTSVPFGEHIISTGLTRLYPIMALSLLSVYEYCQRGCISRMRSCANQAVTAAMDFSLHSLNETSTEAERRAWWGAMLALYISSIDQQASPIISASDPRIKTPFPSFQSSTEPWKLLFETEQAMMSVPEIYDEYLGKSLISNLSSDIHDDIVRFDARLSDLIRKSGYPPQPPCQQSPDATASRNMLSISSLFIHCARIRLHRARAFMDVPMFLEKHCDLAAINQGDRENLANTPHSPDFDSLFFFTEGDSSRICLNSALAISRALERLSLVTPAHLRFQHPGSTDSMTKDGPVKFLLPFFACTAMQSAYSLLMCHYRLKAAQVSGDPSSCHYLLNNSESDLQSLDLERSMHEIRNGLQSVLGAMEGALMFQSVRGMIQEVQIACHSAMLGH